METLLDSISEWQEKDGPMDLTVQRGEETLHLTLTPVWDEQEQKMRGVDLLRSSHEKGFRLLLDCI